MGHSMGGMLAVRYLQMYPRTIKKAVISSPMFKIKLPFAESLVHAIAKTHCFMGMGNARVYGEDPEFPKTASHLEIRETHSKKNPTNANNLQV